ncbi:conserved hypothetical protein [Mucor ambiguus]|uniref:Uncharacterized protein n=1 Tax=Mucor ambiguus TaxID=91626 RepID=A0A0C9MVV0_9FUNG|nr:conserved hypothetical protein [Mucor ambiguus]
MGSGDIKVSPGLLQLDYPCGVVVFQEYDEARPIGKWEPNDRKVAAPEETPVRMTFDKIESIDVVIWALQEAKRMMSEETWQTLLEQPKEAAGDE